MFVRKETIGGVGSRWGAFRWDEDGMVVEVPDELGHELLALRGAGFSEAPEPVKRKPVKAPVKAEKPPAEAKVPPEPASPAEERTEVSE